MTSEQIMLMIQAIGEVVTELIEQSGIGEYVEGFAILVDHDKLRELVKDELLSEAGAELTAEAQQYLDSLT